MKRWKKNKYAVLILNEENELKELKVNANSPKMAFSNAHDKIHGFKGKWEIIRVIPYDLKKPLEEVLSD
jgi:hypothetical protein